MNKTKLLAFALSFLGFANKGIGQQSISTEPNPVVLKLESVDFATILAERAKQSDAQVFVLDKRDCPSLFEFVAAEAKAIGVSPPQNSPGS